MQHILYAKNRLNQIAIPIDFKYMKAVILVRIKIICDEERAKILAWFTCLTRTLNVSNLKFF